jgi:DNA-binding response OmpR family regulator
MNTVVCEVVVPSPVVVIIDDEHAIRSALTTLLTRNGFEVRAAANAMEGMALIRAHAPQLILLDIVLDESNPQAQNGLSVLRAIRTMESFIPVIMLTSYTEWQVESLGLGAIAFVTKPWDAEALIGQIRATLNAVAHIRQDTLRTVDSKATLLINDIEIDTVRYRVSKGQKEVDLTPLEFALLAFLARHPNREWTREALLEEVWGYEWIGYPRTVDRHVAAIRRKLDLDRDELIETVHGAGYRLTT